MTKQEAEAAVEKILDSYVGAEDDFEKRGAVIGYYEDWDMTWRTRGTFGKLSAVVIQGLTRMAMENMSSLDAIRTVDETAKQMMKMIRKRVYDKEWGQKGDGPQ